MLMLMSRERSHRRSTSQGLAVRRLYIDLSCLMGRVLRYFLWASIVAAEYLARGYSLSDQVLTRAIAIDSTSA